MAAVGADVSVVSKQKHLINWPQSAVIGAPPNLLARWDYIETLPFDGVVIFTPDFREVMTPGKTVTYQKVFSDSKLAELAKRFKRVKNNFLMVWAAPAPLDAFDNWDGIIANFAVYAKAAKNAECLGVVFDNEQYRGGIWNYPQNVLHADSHSIEQYRVQMRLRGKQIMTAMISEFPDVQFMSAHGPYWSEPQAYVVIRSVADQLPANTGNLAGAFLSGFVAASVAARAQGNSPKYIDGGELYSMRTQQEFSYAYNWRKNTVASNVTKSLSIPESLRTNWAKNISISFGLYNLPFNKPMNPLILRTTLEYSLREADDLVWFYSDGMDWYTPGSVSQAWIDAASDGFKAGANP